MATRIQTAQQKTPTRVSTPSRVTPQRILTTKQLALKQKAETKLKELQGLPLQEYEKEYNKL